MVLRSTRLELIQYDFSDVDEEVTGARLIHLGRKSEVLVPAHQNVQSSAAGEPSIISEIRHGLRRPGKSLKVFCPNFPVLSGAAICPNRHSDHNSSKITARFIATDGARTRLTVFVLGANDSGGMIPKLQSITVLLRRGVHSAHIIDGTKRNALLSEVFTDKGTGTMIVA